MTSQSAIDQFTRGRVQNSLAVTQQHTLNNLETVGRSINIKNMASDLDLNSTLPLDKTATLDSKNLGATSKGDNKPLYQTLKNNQSFLGAEPLAKARKHKVKPQKAAVSPMRQTVNSKSALSRLTEKESAPTASLVSQEGFPNSDLTSVVGNKFNLPGQTKATRTLNKERKGGSMEPPSRVQISIKQRAGKEYNLKAKKHSKKASSKTQKSSKHDGKQKGQSKEVLNDDVEQRKINLEKLKVQTMQSMNLVQTYLRDPVESALLTSQPSASPAEPNSHNDNEYILVQTDSRGLIEFHEIAKRGKLKYQQVNQTPGDTS